MTHRTKLTLALLLLTFLLPALPAAACQIPVFRYALERWQPDLFTAAVFHQGPLTDSQQTLVQQLRDAATSPSAPANIQVQLIDTSIPLSPTHNLINQQFGPHQASSDTPWVMLRFPQHVFTDTLAFSGPLNEHNTKTLLDSPARQQIADRIIDGQSAVWVLIESGDKAADDAAHELLKQELFRQQNELKLPTIEDLKNDEYYMEQTTVELRLEFSILRLDPSDPDEAIFISMLRNSEQGLHAVKGTIAIPIFGRGRSYFALAGTGISPTQILSNCAFITGACSCQVKQQNPGADMLMAVNWNARVTDTAIHEKPLPELSGLGLLDNPATPNAPINPVTPTYVAEPKPAGLSTFAPSTTPATTLAPTATLAPAIAATPPTLAAAPTTSSAPSTSISLIALVAIALIAVAAGSIFIKSNRHD